MLYISSSELMYHVAGRVYLLYTFTEFPTPFYMLIPTIEKMRRVNWASIIHPCNKHLIPLLVCAGLMMTGTGDAIGNKKKASALKDHVIQLQEERQKHITYISHLHMSCQGIIELKKELNQCNEAERCGAISGRDKDCFVKITSDLPLSQSQESFYLTHQHGWHNSLHLLDLRTPAFPPRSCPLQSVLQASPLLLIL